MGTYEDEISDWASGMNDNSFKVILSNDESICRELIVLNKLEKGKVLYIKGDKKVLFICPKFIDSPQGKVMAINITSQNDINKPDNGIIVWIDLTKKIFADALKNVVKGTAQLHFYTISNDLTEISGKVIFNTQTSKIALKREMELAGV